MKTYVMYHKDCFDGIMAAWAAYKKFGRDARFVAVSYDMDPVPVFDAIPRGSKIFILDFSFKKDVIKRYQKFFDLMVIDHHITAWHELREFNDFIIDVKHSGAALAWKYFLPDAPVPELVLIAQDRDLWKFEMPDTKAIYSSLQTIPWIPESFGIFDALVEGWDKNRQRLVDEGVAINLFKNKMVENIVAHSYIGIMKDHQLPIVNATAFWSEVGKRMLAKYPGTPVVASYYIEENKRIWQLRSVETYDCSEIAKKYGGGGHKNAAGFVEVM